LERGVNNLASRRPLEGKNTGTIMRSMALTIMKWGPGISHPEEGNESHALKGKKDTRSVAQAETEPLDQLSPTVHFILSR
jgi:hypothetical protein